MNSSNNVDIYVSKFPPLVQRRLNELRKLALDVLPNPEETIRYGIITYRLNGKNILHFGGFKNHIGFYPTPSILEEYSDDLAPYKTSKGAAQFSLNDPMPMSLIAKMIKSKLKEHVNSI